MDKRSDEFLKLKDFYVKVMRRLQSFLTTDEIKKHLSYLRSIKKKTIKKTISLGLTNYEIPFLPVLCSNIRHGIIRAKQICFVRYTNYDGEEKKGVFQLNLSKVSDTETETLKHDKHSYFIIGVDLNTDIKGLKPVSYIERYQVEKKRSLTLAEVIALLIQQPQLLDKYTILACGSEYKIGGRKLVPCVRIQDGIPTIMAIEADKSDICYISPTCKERIMVNIFNTTSTIIKFRPWRRPNPI